MLQELSDSELEMVSGTANLPGNIYLTVIENHYTFNTIYAPTYVVGIISHSSVANGNTYTINNNE